MFAGWTRLLSAFHITCSSHRRMLYSLFNSILPQPPRVKLLIYIFLFTAWHQCWSIDSASVYLWLWGLLDFASLIYDIVADCSDNVPTRYLVNDACVLSGKPLVSASALRLEGQVMIKICISCWVPNISLPSPVCLQLTVYNYHGGPCYRCLYPVPPPPETVTNCSDGGVLGVGESSPPNCPEAFTFVKTRHNFPLFLKYQG